MTKHHYMGPLFTDFYELTMAAGYFKQHMVEKATFSVFIRNHTAKRDYFVAAGLEDVLHELKNSRFSESDIRYLQTSGLFPEKFLEYLKKFRFSGEIFAIPEGTIFFPDEPLLEITAPLIQAQLFETFILNTLGFQTMIATKAARCIHAADGRPLIDFALRRAQGTDAGIKVARGTYIAGFQATSNVLAGKIFDIPLSGTMAHSYVTAFDNEHQAFSAYARTFPKNSVFLIDTYDVIEGTRNAVRVGLEMQSRGDFLVGVRLDSGDMADLSCRVRRILDDAGLDYVKIFASSGFDEFKIADVIQRGAKIDAFGVGTKMGVSADAPYLDIVYKMVRFRDKNIRKLSPGKVTLAGRKQVFRRTGPGGCCLEDVIGTREEHIPGSTPLLKKVVENGRLVRPGPSLPAIRENFRRNFADLDEKYKTSGLRALFPIRLSTRLKALQDQTAAAPARRQDGKQEKYHNG